MSKFIEKNTYPFTREQIRLFRKEMEEAGGSEELMIKKEALKTTNGCMEIALYRDIEEYKEKYLSGVYEPLREHYDTEIPYVFWGRLYNALKNVNSVIARKNG